MSAIGIGVIGLGRIAAGVHLPGIQKSARGALAAVCDVNPAVLSAVGDRYGVPAERRFLDYRRLIAAPEVQAVDICLPNHLHGQAVLEAVRAGKPFAVEKPLALDAAEAAAMAQAADRAGVPGMVCFSCRFYPAARYARALIDRGELGEVRSVLLRYLKSSGLRPGRRLEWRFVKRLAGSGAWGDLGSHMIDLTRFLLGEVEALFAQTTIVVPERRGETSEALAPVDTDDVCDGVARLAGGASAAFSISRAAWGVNGAMTLEVFGTKGALCLDLNRGRTLSVAPADPAGSAAWETRPVPPEYEASQTEAFLDLVEGKADSLAPRLADGVACQRILDAGLESDRTRRWVAVG